MARDPSASERQRLEQALRWLRSHLNRLRLERKSLESKLDQLTTEIERVSDEIGIAEERERSLAED